MRAAFADGLPGAPRELLVAESQLDARDDRFAIFRAQPRSAGLVAVERLAVPIACFERRRARRFDPGGVCSSRSRRSVAAGCWRGETRLPDPVQHALAEIRLQRPLAMYLEPSIFLNAGSRVSCTRSCVSARRGRARGRRPVAHRRSRGR